MGRKQEPEMVYMDGVGYFLPAMEGHCYKGGRNERPSTPRPPPPTVLPSAYKSHTFLKMCGYSPKEIEIIIKQ